LAKDHVLAVQTGLREKKVGEMILHLVGRLQKRGKKGLPGNRGDARHKNTTIKKRKSTRLAETFQKLPSPAKEKKKTLETFVQNQPKKQKKRRYLETCRRKKFIRKKKKNQKPSESGLEKWKKEPSSESSKGTQKKRLRNVLTTGKGRAQGKDHPLKRKETKGEIESRKVTPKRTEKNH